MKTLKYILLIGGTISMIVGEYHRQWNIDHVHGAGLETAGDLVTFGYWVVGVMMLTIGFCIRLEKSK